MRRKRIISLVLLVLAFVLICGCGTGGADGAGGASAGTEVSENGDRKGFSLKLPEAADNFCAGSRNCRELPTWLSFI